MKDPDLIFIAQSEVVNYQEYSKLPLDRIELYKALVFPRMVYYRKGFRSHLDIINYFRDGKFFADADYPERRRLLNIWNLPGFNSMHIPNYLARFGIRTKVINNFDAEWDIFRDSYESYTEKPLIGISSTFHLSYAESQRISRKIRERYPSAEIVLGGAFANEQSVNGRIEDFEKPMRKAGIRYVIYSFNSEVDLKDLILKRKNGADTAMVNNLAYVENGDFGAGGFRANAARWNAPVLEEAPLSWNEFDLPFVNHTVQARTSSGCPFSCAFCSYPKTAGNFSVMSCESAEKYVNNMLRIPGVDKIIFVDDTFNAPPERFKEMCRAFSKYDFEWFSFLRSQFIDDDTASLMKDSGCVGIYAGVESANNAVLKNMNKKATAAQFEKGLRSLKKHGIASVAAFIIGFPGETDESIKDDIKFIESSGLDFYTLKEFYYMKHTPVYENRRNFGLAGAGNNWKHDTMDYKTAQEKKIEIFKAVKNSAFIDPDASLWHIAYLYDQGYSLDAISGIQKLINKIIKDQTSGACDDDNPSFRELNHMLSGETVNR